VPRWSRLAFASMATAGIAGTVLMVAISPRWSGLAGSEYGRFLFLKLALVAGLLATASRARDFTRRRLPTLVVPPAWGSTSEVATLEAPIEMRPLLTAVATELYLAASILAATAILVGRPPPS
jgi:putative copper export protein